MKVARLVVYDFAKRSELDEQLGRSINDGTKTFGPGRQIRVTTLPSPWRWWHLVKTLWF
jgi:hypothetical protein